MDSQIVRRMSRAELDGVVAWAAQEGWNPGRDDAGAFWAADPEGFFVAERAGEIVGAISAVRYGADYGFVGLFIVRPGERGRELGWRLAEAALAHLGERVIGIDGVLAKERQYAKFFGFRLAHRNVRYGGVPRGLPAPSAGLEPVAAVPFVELAAFDARHVPAPRETFLRAWLELPHGFGLVAREGGGIAGYGVARECVEGWKIGPLFAARPEVAADLLAGLAAGAGGGVVYLDVPEDNAAARALAARHGLAEVFATARMYRGAAPALPREAIYGITTFELG